MVWGGGYLAENGMQLTLRVAQWCISIPVSQVWWPALFWANAKVIPNPRCRRITPFVLIGAALLWVGWFGFNAGSELAADGVAGMAQ